LLRRGIKGEETEPDPERGQQHIQRTQGPREPPRGSGAHRCVAQITIATSMAEFIPRHALSRDPRGAETSAADADTPEGLRNA